MKVAHSFLTHVLDVCIDAQIPRSRHGRYVTSDVGQDVKSIRMSFVPKSIKANTRNLSNNHPLFPQLRAFTFLDRPRLPIHRKIMINRPTSSTHTRPITTWLFFAGTDAELAKSTELILDFPGGGFVAMGPSHHEERLRSWAIKSRRPVLSVDYGKAPECTFLLLHCVSFPPLYFWVVDLFAIFGLTREIVHFWYNSPVPIRH